MHFFSANVLIQIISTSSSKPACVGFMVNHFLVKKVGVNLNGIIVKTSTEEWRPNNTRQVRSNLTLLVLSRNYLIFFKSCLNYGIKFQTTKKALLFQLKNLLSQHHFDLTYSSHFTYDNATPAGYRFKGKEAISK